MARGAIGLNESTFTQGIKTNSTASAWLTALGLVNPLFGTITATNAVLTGTGAGVEQFFDATGSTNGYVKLSVPSTVGTNYTLLLPSQPATGFLYGTWDGTNTVTLSWNTNGASGSSPTLYLGVTNVPYAWYDARTNVYTSGTTPAADNQVVSQWTDLSGNGRHLTNTFTGNQWVYKLNQQNGLPGLTGTSVQMQTAQSFGGLTSVSVFMVMQPVTWTGYAMYIGGTTESSGTDWVYLQGSASGDAYFGWGSGTDRATSASFLPGSTTVILQGRVVSLLAGIRKNNAAWTDAVASSTGSTPVTAFRMGRADQASSFKVFSVVIFSPALSSTDANTVEASLNATWAVH